MKLSDGIKQAENTSGGKYHKNGIFTKKMHLINVEDCSNNPMCSERPIYTFNSGFKPQQCLKLNFKLEAREEPYSMYLFSKYMWKDNDKTFAGWRFKNNCIVDFLGLFSDFDIPSNWEIPKEINNIRDITLVGLSYCTGAGEGDRADKCNFQTWDRFVLYKEDESNDEILVQRFIENSKWLIDNNKYLPNYYEAWKETHKPEENPTDTTGVKEEELPF